MYINNENEVDHWKCRINLIKLIILLEKNYLGISVWYFCCIFWSSWLNVFQYTFSHCLHWYYVCLNLFLLCVSIDISAEGDICSRSLLHKSWSILFFWDYFDSYNQFWIQINSLPSPTQTQFKDGIIFYLWHQVIHLSKSVF